MTDAGAEGASRQARVGAALRRDTRDRLLHAAATEFVARGYAGTTVTRIAATAGVSVQTLYLAWGSKRALLRGCMEQALAGDADSPDAMAGRFDGLAPRERLVELAAAVGRVAERASSGWRLYRDAAAVDPEIAADWDELQRLRRGTFERIVGTIPPDALRDGLSASAAIDSAWAIASPESHELLVDRLGYELEAFRSWMESTLIAALLRD
jgi:AcrR family transcriptional regulator